MESPLDWPGINCAGALIDGTPLAGRWYDRTRLFYARRRGERPRDRDFASAEEVVFTRLPCWSHLTAELTEGHELSRVTLSP